jgi:nitroreductase
MELFEAILSRRSVRRYAPDPIPPEVTGRLLEAATWAPSGGNIQPWQFVVTSDPGQIEELKSVSPGMFGRPRLVVACCVDRRRAEERSGPGGLHIATLDVAMATQNLLLAAHGLGLGACAILSFHPAAVQELLGCPGWVVPTLLVAAGYPEVETPRPSRRPLEEVTHHGAWGRRETPGERGAGS